MQTLTPKSKSNDEIDSSSEAWKRIERLNLNLNPSPSEKNQL
jgi:hypothetical protein